MEGRAQAGRTVGKAEEGRGAPRRRHEGDQRWSRLVRERPGKGRCLTGGLLREESMFETLLSPSSTECWENAAEGRTAPGSAKDLRQARGESKKEE